jgi:hypothetical protein
MVIPGVVQAINMFDKEIALLAKKTGVSISFNIVYKRYKMYIVYIISFNTKHFFILICLFLNNY